MAERTSYSTIATHKVTASVPPFYSTFFLKEQPSVSLHLPPVGWQSMTLQLQAIHTQQPPAAYGPLSAAAIYRAREVASESRTASGNAQQHSALSCDEEPLKQSTQQQTGNGHSPLLQPKTAPYISRTCRGLRGNSAGSQGTCKRLNQDPKKPLNRISMQRSRSSRDGSP